MRLKIAEAPGYAPQEVEAEEFLPGLFIHPYLAEVPGEYKGRPGYWQISHHTGRFVIGRASRALLESMRDVLARGDWTPHDPGEDAKAALWLAYEAPPDAP